MSYHEHFGLREIPFKFSLSNGLFLGAAHLDGLAKLEGAFCEPSGLTLLVGEAGTGKTTLIHVLLARLNDDTVRVVKLTDPTMSFAEMLGVMVQQIGIHPAGTGKLASLQSLKTFLADPGSTIKVVLIFDDAQRLSDETLEELRLLSDASPPQRHTLQIILVGRPELVQRLADPKLRALNQRIGAPALLRPLRGAEIQDYINCLLRAQGALHEVFSRAALVEVASLSEGLPRKISDLCHSSLLLAYSDGSTVVQPQHVWAANAEIEYLRGVSGRQDDQPIEARRGAVHWMRRKGKPFMAGWLSAIAVAGVLALEFGRGRSGAWFARPPDLHRDLTRGGGESSKPMSSGAGQGHEEPRPETQTAAPPGTDQSADQDGGPSTQTPLAYAPQPVAPKERTRSTGSSLTAPITGFPAELSTSLTSTNSASPEPAVTPTPSDNRLTYEQERRLRYEIRRAKSSFGGGNYTNAIYHLKRALLLDPGTSELRDLLQRAQAAQSNQEKGGGSMASSPVPSVAVARPNYGPEMRSEASSANPSAEGTAPPVPAAETLPLINRSAPSASASGEVAATPDSAATSPSASTGHVPARPAGFNIQIQGAMDQKNANQIVSRLQQLDYRPRLVSISKGGQTLYSVEIGPYASQTDAAAAKAELRLRYNSAFDPPAPILGDDSPDLLLPFSSTPLRIGLSTDLAATASHYNRGLVYAQHGQTDDAISEFSAAVRDNPRDAEAYHNLALMLEKSGNLEGAVTEFQGSLAIDPNSEPTHLLLADAYARRGDLDLAAAQYQATLRLDPNDPRTHNNYGLLLRRRGDLTGAIKQYQMALALSPDDFAARVNLGIALYEAGDLGGASRELNRAISLHIISPLPHEVLGFVFFEMNHLDDALFQWQTAASLDPGSADIAAAMAIGLWRKGNKPDSLTSYRQALSLNRAYVCDDRALRTQGYWTAAAVDVLHDVRAFAGPGVCRS